MTKYTVYLKSGTVLEVEAKIVSANAEVVHFYSENANGPETAGSFPMDSIFGFYASDKVERVQSIKGIN